jgi:hypothetical protein
MAVIFPWRIMACNIVSLLNPSGIHGYHHITGALLAVVVAHLAQKASGEKSLISKADVGTAAAMPENCTMNRATLFCISSRSILAPSIRGG